MLNIHGCKSCQKLPCHGVMVKFQSWFFTPQRQPSQGLPDAVLHHAGAVRRSSAEPCNPPPYHRHYTPTPTPPPPHPPSSCGDPQGPVWRMRQCVVSINDNGSLSLLSFSLSVSLYLSLSLSSSEWLTSCPKLHYRHNWDAADCACVSRAHRGLLHEMNESLPQAPAWWVVGCRWAGRWYGGIVVLGGICSRRKISSLQCSTEMQCNCYILAYILLKYVYRIFIPAKSCIMLELVWEWNLFSVCRVEDVVEWSHTIEASHSLQSIYIDNSWWITWQVLTSACPCLATLLSSVLSRPGQAMILCLGPDWKKRTLLFL